MIIFVLITVLISSSLSAIITKINNDECLVDPKLVNEIQSYKNVTKTIMDEIINVEGQRFYQHYTKFIDKFGARPAGTDTLEKAIDYIIRLTTTNGITDVTTDDVEVPYWARGTESLQMLKPYIKKLDILGLGSSISTLPGGIVAEAVVVRTFDELKKLDDSEVRNKIVVYNQDYISYGDSVIYRAIGASEAAKKGAVAALVRSITPFSIYTPHTGHQHYEANVTKIAVASITVEDANLFQRLQEAGKTISLHFTLLNKATKAKSRNVIVDLKGSVSPNKYVVVSGHMDSWDVGEGAMDDGGGMIISWYTPLILHHLGFKPKRTVRAMLWTSEERGLIGSASYIKHHPEELKNINFILESDEGTFSPVGLDVGGTKNARCIIAEVLKLFSPIDKITSNTSPGSDMSQFVALGVPGASLLNKNEKYFWYYHSNADTMVIQDKKAVIECAAFWAAISYVLADISVDIPRT